MNKDKKAYHILIIEDNFGDFVLFEEYLLDYMLNPTLIQARSFQEAQSILENSENTFDVIFLDLSLPDLSGEKLIKDVLEIANNIPVLALTGFPDFDFSIKTLALGVFDYLLKDELTPITLYKSILYAIERKKHFEDLQKSKKRYSELFHLSPLPMWVYDLDTLRFLDINEASIVHYGYSKEEFLSMTIQKLLPINNFPVLEENQTKARQEKLMGQKSIFIHVKKNGELIKVEATINNLIFNGQKSTLVLVNDITDRLKYVETIEIQNQTFKEIAWIQSHIVRAPLARLMGLINLLESDTIDTDPKLIGLLGHIKNSSIELDEIIRDISKKSESISPLDENEPSITNN